MEKDAGKNVIAPRDSPETVEREVTFLLCMALAIGACDVAVERHDMVRPTEGRFGKGQGTLHKTPTEVGCTSCIKSQDTKVSH